MYGGGSVSQKLGDFLIENGITLQSVYGGTEVGGPAYSSLREDDKKEWEYVEFGKNCDVRWIPQGEGTYECHLYVRLPPYFIQCLRVQRILTYHAMYHRILPRIISQFRIYQTRGTQLLIYSEGIQPRIICGNCMALAFNCYLPWPK